MPQTQSLPAAVLPSEAVQYSYYPSLNGLRGISIIIVVLSHLQLPIFGGFEILINGPLGVNIFFVLSGFLITTLCVKELNATGKLSLKKFYTRRFLRIFPVAYLYIFVILLLNIIYKLEIPWFQFAGAAAYLGNFSYFRSHSFTWVLSHYWSLSVEEQFYIIFPFILKKSRTIFTWCIIFIVTGLLVVCTIQDIFPPLNQGLPYYFSHYFIKFQSIAIGCLFSLLIFKKRFDHPYFVKLKILGNATAIFFIFYLGFDNFYGLHAIFKNCAISILTGYVVVSNLAPAKDVFFRLFNLKALSFIGVLSYSIYIWQQLFVSNDLRLPFWIVKPPYNIILLIIVPLLSYYGYERYFLKLKDKFKVLKTKPTVL